MAAALLAPFLADLGIFVAEGTGAILGSEAAGTAIGTLAVGALASEVGTQVEKQLVDSVGTKKVKDIQDTFNDLISSGVAGVSQNTQYFVNKRKSEIIDFKTQDPRKNPADNVPSSDELNVETGDPISDETMGGVPVDKKTKYTTKDIANFVTLYSSEVAIQGLESNQINPIKAMSDVVKYNPSYLDLSKILGSFLSSKIPDTETYKAIAAVYNGLNMNIATNCVQGFDTSNGLIYFDLTDELGSTVRLYQTTGLVLPAIWGVFTGPYSRNNEMPVSLLDLFAAFHDYDYGQGGFFDQAGDYKLISRSSQNFFRMTPEEQPYARTTILYFSTLGHVASSLKGSLSSDVATNKISDGAKDDIFPAIVPESIHMDPVHYETARFNFYQDLERDFDQESKTSSLFASSGGYRSQLLAREFGDIQIQLL